MVMTTMLLISSLIVSFMSFPIDNVGVTTISIHTNAETNTIFTDQPKSN